MVIYRLASLVIPTTGILKHLIKNFEVLLTVHLSKYKIRIYLYIEGT